MEKGKQSKRYQLKTYHKSGAKIIDAVDFSVELISVFELTKGLSLSRCSLNQGSKMKMCSLTSLLFFISIT